MFITFEGAEGSGKTTAVQYLAEQLKELGHDVITTKEPGGTLLGKQIREILIHEDKTIEPIYPVSQLLLLLADRLHHIHTVILPNLAEGKIVISDRYMDSTWVYQGILGKLDYIIQNVLNSHLLNILHVKPDLTFFLDVSETTSRIRLKARNENNALDDIYMNHEISLNQAYLTHFEYQKTLDRKIAWIDANLSLGEVKQQIRKEMIQFIETEDRLKLNSYRHKILKLL